MSMRLLSQLAHIELLTPTLDASTAFYVDVLGLEESERTATSVYLRCWGDNFHHSVQLTEAPAAGVGHIAWRADGQDGLDEAVARLEAAGVGEGWTHGSLGHGPAFRYRGPGGQLQEVFWDVDRWQCPADLRSTYPSRPQRRQTRGCGLRQLDHVTLSVVGDVLAGANFFRDTLRYRFTEYTVLEDSGDCFFAMLTTNEHAHDLGLLLDSSGIPGRIHHVAFWLDEPGHVYEAAETLLEAGAVVEMGPGRHGMGEEVYLYTRDPSGMRIEFMSGGRRNYEPDWETVRWAPSQGSFDFYRNTTPPGSLIDAFPPTPGGVSNPWAAAQA